jgi:hypothetical protein
MQLLKGASNTNTQINAQVFKHFPTYSSFISYQGLFFLTKKVIAFLLKIATMLSVTPSIDLNLF